MAVLEAAIHNTTLKRIVVTSSAVSLIPMEWLGTLDTETVFTGEPPLTTITQWIPY
jgi:hypothetical protein